MEKKGMTQETFVIQVLHQQNATWQGTITWTSSQLTKPFRSALELMKLIDSTLDLYSSTTETQPQPCA